MDLETIIIPILALHSLGVLCVPTPQVKYRKAEAEAKGHADSLARSNSVFSKPTGKKRKANEVEEFVMVPVSRHDG